ncbi:hypothetical protein MASR2M48_21320 [Spirochaetota bacterium]
MILWSLSETVTAPGKPVTQSGMLLIIVSLDYVSFLGLYLPYFTKAGYDTTMTLHGEQ